MQEAKLLAITGIKGSGKDTVASMMGHYLQRSRKFAFGTHLKNIAALAFDVPLEVFYEERLKEKVIGEFGMSPRVMVTSLADLLRDKYGDDFFAKRVRHEWALCKDSNRTLLVTDLRAYEGGVEEALLRTLGAKVIHVHRPTEDLQYKNYDHHSENMMQVQPGDIVIENASTLCDLLIQVRSILTDLYGPKALDQFPYVPKELTKGYLTN